MSARRLVMMGLISGTFLVARCPPVYADAPAATQSTQAIKTAFNNLASADPTVRERARVELLGLHRDQLTLLHDIARQSQPLAPAQSANLHDIVTHIFLTGEPYEKSTVGVIGIHLDMTFPMVTIGDRKVPGVPVLDRLPGFVGYRFLQTGDLITGVSVDGTPAAAAPDEFTELIQSLGPGRIITLELVRRGRLMHVTFALDAAPAILLTAAIPAGVDQAAKTKAFFDERLRLAEQYWSVCFQPLLAAAD